MVGAPGAQPQDVVAEGIDAGRGMAREPQFVERGDRIEVTGHADAAEPRTLPNQRRTVVAATTTLRSLRSHRVDWATVAPAPQGEQLGSVAVERRPGALLWELTARLDRSMRAPSGEELAMSNVHLAIGGFEMGSLDLDEEEAVNLSVAARYRSEKLRITLEAYRYAFDSFIYQRETTDDHGGLPVFQWSQTEATFVGFDAEARAELVTAAEHTVDLIARYDWVATDVDDPHESHLPRIPPQRVSVAAEFTWKAFWGRAAYSRFFDQDEVTSYETPTDGYGNLDLEGEYATYLGGADLILLVAGRNLGDEEQRQHTSLVKEEAPLAGRRVEAGVRILF